MNNTQLYIPKKCKAGLQLREGTYTGKLGYIIYNDGKVWRKENHGKTGGIKKVIIHIDITIKVLSLQVSNPLNLIMFLPKDLFLIKKSETPNSKPICLSQWKYLVVRIEST